MQSLKEVCSILERDRPDIAVLDRLQMACYLQQLPDCYLQSAAAQAIDENAWLHARLSGIGGSEIAAIIGESSWDSPFSIWQLKTGQVAIDAKPQSEQARWGNLLEDVVLAEWSHRTGRSYVKLPVILCSNTVPFAFANIDGFEISSEETVDITVANVEGCYTCDLCYNGNTYFCTIPKIVGLCEVKTTSLYNGNAWDTGEIPYHYICQTTWYQAVTGIHTCEIMCLVGGQHLYNYVVPYMPDLVERLFTTGGTFWNVNVKQLIQPELTAADLERLQEAIPDDDTEPVILEDEGSNNLAVAYVQLRDQLSGLKKVQNAIKAKLLDALGKNTQAVTTEHTLVIQRSSRDNCDVTLLREFYPAAYLACVKQTKINTLKVK